MSFFKKINLKNYINFQFFEKNFIKNCNVFYGINGSGKSNVLESISMFDKGTGFRNDRLVNIIRSGEDNFFNYGNFNYVGQEYNIKIFSQRNNEKISKKIQINNENNKDSLNHFRSLLSFIYFQPEMERFFLSTPSYKRKFIDRFIYSHNKNYNKIIIEYKKNILERSKLLKLQTPDEEWIKNIEENISKLGIEIYKCRLEQIEILNSNLLNLYSDKKSPYLITMQINDDFLNRNIDIINDLDNYKKHLKNNRKNDFFSGMTNFGPHRSDFSGLINNDFPLNQLSTGEQKTIILLLILAQCSFLINECKIYPIILMDEICSHLDDINRSILLKLTNEFDLQFFMTGTDKSLFSFLSTNAEYYNISNQ